MKFTNITKLDGFECTDSDGTQYVRFSATNWGVWVGESLELEQSDCAELEAAFQAEKTHDIQTPI